MSNNSTTHKLNIAKANNSIPIWGTNFTDLGFSALLGEDVEATVVVPGGVTVAILRYTPGANIWVSNGTAPIVVPVGGFTQSRLMLSPTAVWVQPGDTLRFVSVGADAFVNINFFDNSGI
jgi:hypothetical protein